MDAINSTNFTTFGYGASNRRGFVKVVEIPYGYKGKAVKAVNALESDASARATSGGLKSEAVAAALASVGLKEVEIAKSRQYTTVKWVKC